MVMENRPVDPGSIQGSHRPISFIRIKHRTRANDNLCKYLAMLPSLSSPGLSYDTKFVHIGWELRSSLVGDTILGVQSEPACKEDTCKEDTRDSFEYKIPHRGNYSL